MFTDLLPAYTDAQVGLVYLLLSTSRDTLVDVVVRAQIDDVRHTKWALVVHILTHLANPRLQKVLCLHALAQPVWFGLPAQPPEAEPAQPGLFDHLEEDDGSPD